LGGVIVFAIFSDAINFALYLIDYSRRETPTVEELGRGLFEITRLFFPLIFVLIMAS
jgi:multisubunit Na+/H+ antiporter MnhC subunit